MIELKGTGGRTYYLLQASPEQLMTFVPYGPYNPASVVQQSLLAEAGFMTRVTTGNGQSWETPASVGWFSGFYIETWRVR